MFSFGVLREELHLQLTEIGCFSPPWMMPKSAKAFRASLSIWQGSGIKLPYLATSLTHSLQIYTATITGD
ncbi:unnamed protein product [Clavelina lepadiformis]|uniref:Uncharacterized protein n=1 Tax=Clavelina lepadiformis TaxID=159417 RepID=A0ABP0GUY2_CLALP